jgi:nicotinate-nucleotide adenylyltransferase
MSGVPSEAYRIPRTIGVFGGSFNPPHISHVLAVHYALSVWPVDLVLVVPSFSHPFEKDLVPFEHRLHMARIAFEHLPGWVEVSPVDEELGSVSYMIDTIRELRNRFPVSNFRLVVGSDILEELPRWKEHDALRVEAPLLVIPRIGGGRDAQVPSHPECCLPAISSTEIRDALLAGANVDGMLPRRVLEYIREHDLYKP